MAAESFAGFSRAEWETAFARGMTAPAAVEEANRLFEAIAASGSNGYSIPAELWALLGHVSEHGRERVLAATHDYPEQFRRTVLSLLAQEAEIDTRK
jgi:hypothetical protein